MTRTGCSPSGRNGSRGTCGPGRWCPGERQGGFPLGYPMTMSRVLSRNALKDGDYGKPPRYWHVTGPATIETDPRVIQLVKEHREANEAMNGRMGSLAGDLRRLEADTLDEGAISEWIQRRTGLDQDTIAAV